MPESSNDRAEIEEMLAAAQQDSEPNRGSAQHEQTAVRHGFRRMATWYAAHRKSGIFLTLLITVGILGVIPFSRYTIAGLVVSHDLELQVVDKQTNQPVSGADVVLRGQTVKTNGSGIVGFQRVKPGRIHVKISKKNYQDSDTVLTVGLKKPTHHIVLNLMATGRQVPIRVTDKISGKGLSGTTIVAAGTDSQTDQSGNANIVVDAASTSVEAEIKADGYNTQRVNLTVSQEITANTFALTPSGKLYFLSKQSGNIDVVKIDLDGTNRQTVLAGTGNEEETNTVMLASREWKFLALLARREGTHASLYLIDTSSDKLTEVDTNNAGFNLVGWSGHNFVYTTRSSTTLDWQSGQSQIKTFNADTGTLIKVDETTASGTGYADYAAESVAGVYLVDDSIVYAKNWIGDSAQTASKRPGMYVAKANGNDKKLVKDFEQSYLTVVQSGPHELYLQQSTMQGKTIYYSYENALLKQDDQLTNQSFNQFYATYLLSPSSNKTFWYEPRDGKNTLFVGDQNGKNGRELLSVGEYVTYGWYSDDYVLLSKNGSELYIASSNDTIDEAALQKVTDYHKPAISYPGYGGGYGGL